MYMDEPYTINHLTLHYFVEFAVAATSSNNSSFWQRFSADHMPYLAPVH